MPPSQQRQGTADGSGHGEALQKQLAAARKAIRGKISQRLRAKKSKMKFEVSNVAEHVFAALVGKHPSQLVKRGAYYTMEEVMPKDLLPGVLELDVAAGKRLWFIAIDPETWCVRGSTCGHPKSVRTDRACELRYKPSASVLSVTAWNGELRSWEECCLGRAR
jgi:hypothetical protein